MKTEVHAPGFHAFAQQTLLNARCRATAVFAGEMDFIDRLILHLSMEDKAFRDSYSVGRSLRHAPVL